ncbi:LacI family DNA-binding transcriptional regulator [uncultured Roseobacter sp.]|uniref:LacI family DNA-binding transcriptional regulator n=1 Tax=uncultured Roseobacter sp. TaxID=114847 RepID=UPI00262D1863|nr:LacI family DNA-binding transcriptional regulator [uncultured Roseobacter sp.]
MSTVKDVAREAGVSVGTVSKVLSNDQTVKPVLRARVMQAVTELNYRPNMAARALRTNKINTIGLVVPDITNPFFAQLALGIETEAAKRGHLVMLTNSHEDPHTEQRQIAALLEQSPRGLIVVASNDSSAALDDAKVRVLSVDRRFHACPLISTNHVIGASKVASHLVNLGHRRLAYLSGPQNTEVGRQRLQGFKTQFERHQKQDASLSLVTREGQFDYESGEQHARDLLAGPKHTRPTAIAAASDQMAIGVLRAARDMEISVPEELSVTGYDDITLASLVVPRLTTLAQPTMALAAEAVTQILQDADVALTDALVEGELIIRGSTAAAPR